MPADVQIRFPADGRAAAPPYENPLFPPHTPSPEQKILITIAYKTPLKTSPVVYSLTNPNTAQRSVTVLIIGGAELLASAPLQLPRAACERCEAKTGRNLALLIPGTMLHRWWSSASVVRAC